MGEAEGSNGGERRERSEGWRKGREGVHQIFRMSVRNCDGHLYLSLGVHGGHLGMLLLKSPQLPLSLSAQSGGNPRLRGGRGGGGC